MTLDFDTQADQYDKRTGLSERNCQAIVQTVLELAAMQPEDCILELGAGTGQIGTWFIQSPLRYIGLDISNGMLEQFRQRLPDDSAGKIIHGDANQAWPVDDRSVHIIFSSRALHWLSLDHIIQESLRVACSDGTLLIIGRIRRERNSIATRMQQEMRRRLKQHGFEEQSGDRHQNQLIEHFRQLDANILDPVIAMRRMVKRAPQHSLDSWQNKPGLAGIEPPTEIKQSVLEELHHWAQTEFGDLTEVIESEETYVLQGIHITPLEGSRGIESIARKS